MKNTLRLIFLLSILYAFTGFNLFFHPFDILQSSTKTYDLGDCNYKIGENGPVENDELVLVQKNENEVGFGKKNLPDSPLSFIDDLDWTPELKQQLINDLESTPSLIQKFIDVPYTKKIELAEAWKFVRESIPKLDGTTTKFALDSKTLEKVSDMMSEGSSFRNALGGNWEENLIAILKQNDDLKCLTCGTSGRPYRSNMNDFLDEVVHFVSNFDITNNTKGKKFFNLLQGKTIDGAAITNKNLPIFDELHQTIKYLKDNPTINQNTIQGFGLQIGNTSKLTDIAHTSTTPKYTELKSLMQGTGADDGLDVLSGLNANPLKNRTQFVAQFKDGYLASINSLDELRYVFDARKLGVDGETFIKNQFKDLFTSKKEDIFEVIWNNQNLRESLFPNLLEDEFLRGLNSFTELIASTESKLYSFIKVE